MIRLFMYGLDILISLEEARILYKTGAQKTQSKVPFPFCRPVIAVLDVEEEESPCHEHAQDGDGGQDAVERHVDVAPL